MKRIPLTLLSSLLFISSGFSEGVNIYYEGNSLTGAMKGLFQTMAHDAGLTDHKYTHIGAAGIPIDWSWKHQSGEIKVAMEENAPFDFVQVQPYGHGYYGGMGGKRAPAEEAWASAHIYREALKHSPNCTLLVYFVWSVNSKEIGSLENWEKAMQESIDLHFWPLAEMLTQYFPDNPVYIVPSGLALMALNDSIKAGNVPGINSIDSLYNVRYFPNDGVHLNATGLYFNSCVQYATIYQKSPEGLPFVYTVNRGIYNGAQDVELNETQARIFQRTAWDVVRNYPRTLVTRTERPKSDTEAPSKVTGITVTEKTKNKLSLTWNPSTDNHGVEKYLVYAYTNQGGTNIVDGNGWRTSVGFREPIDTSTTIGLQPGLTYKLVIRAADSLHNLSEPSDTLEITMEETVTAGGKWKFDFGKAGTPVADGFTEIVEYQLYNADKGYGWDDVNGHNHHSDIEPDEPLYGDGHRVPRGAFLIDVPNGTYNVTVHFGKRDSDMDVTAEGEKKLDNINAADGHKAESFSVDVADEQLTLSFNGSRYFLLSGLEISPPTGLQKHSIIDSKKNPFIVTTNRYTNILKATIPAKGELHCDILNLQGRLVHTQAVRNGQVSISTESMRSGMYILRLHKNGVSFEKRFLIP